ncbi:TPA: peptide pheromone SHP3, partial [Streptococcus pyogenes]
MKKISKFLPILILAMDII